MAVRRPAGFNVPLGFYDGPEVKSIPRRIRAAAVGVWALCGAFSANKLQDGYVGPETLRELCCTDAIRSALMSTKGSDGQPDPLWVEGHSGGIQFTKWGKYQRSRDEVKAWRQSEADRKKADREAKRAAGNGSTTAGRTHASTPCSSTNAGPNVDVIFGDEIASTSADSEMSGRTSGGHPADHCDPRTKTETKTEITTYVTESPTETYGAGISATRGADLVWQIVPKEHPPATLTTLRIQASELLKGGTDTDVVRAALQLWCDKPGVGNGRTILSSLCSEVIKSRNAPQRSSGGLTAGESKVAGWEAIGQRTNHNQIAINP